MMRRSLDPDAAAAAIPTGDAAARPIVAPMLRLLTVRTDEVGDAARDSAMKVLGDWIELLRSP